MLHAITLLLHSNVIPLLAPLNQKHQRRLEPVFDDCFIEIGFVFDGDIIPAVYDGEQVLDRVVDMVQRGRAARLPVVYVQHAGGDGHPLEQGSRGWHIHPKVQPEKDDVIVAKTTPDSFYETDLKAELQALGAENLVIVGNQTDYCVDTTCRRARSLGYQVTLIKDAHSTWDNDYLTAQQIIDHHNFVLGRQFVTISDSSRIDFNQLP